MKKTISAELESEVSHSPLKVSGRVPEWLAGTFVRNGPTTVTVDGKSNAHWFDGLAMLHAFSFNRGEVTYSNRFLRTPSYQALFKRGSLNYDGFATDPCRSLFKRFFSLFFPHNFPNANVNVTKIAEAYVALTEIPLPVRFDLETLETLGRLHYKDRLPHEGCWESAHPHYDARSQQTFNYLIEFGRQSHYLLYAIDEGQTRRNLVAKIPVDHPSYMHSFAMTERYLLLTEFPLVVNPIDLITSGEPFIRNFKWQPERGTRFTLVDRQSGQLLGQWTTRPFFAFHHANAFEVDGKLLVDLVAYEDASVLTEDPLYVGSKLKVGKSYPSRLERFSLDLKSGSISSEILFNPSIEFPKSRESLDGVAYRYLYATGFGDRAELLQSESLYKIETQTRSHLVWSEEGCCPGEPLFVPSPDGKDEDDGAILTVVIQGDRSSLLILDAKSFQEVGRAEAPHRIPTGLHGHFFSP